MGVHLRRELHGHKITDEIGTRQYPHFSDKTISLISEFI